MSLIDSHVDSMIDWVAEPKAAELPRIIYEVIMGKELMRHFNYKKKTGGFIMGESHVSCYKLPRGHEDIPAFRVMKLIVAQLE